MLIFLAVNLQVEETDMEHSVHSAYNIICSILSKHFDVVRWAKCSRVAFIVATCLVNSFNGRVQVM